MSEKILLSHGSGGALMHALIKEVLLKKLNNPILNELSDSACVSLAKKTAFTTDSFVVNPLFFPGGDIGKLCVCGTVNDLVMAGAVPEYLSLAIIAEEGFELERLKKIIDSISCVARKSNARIVTGDFKVVEKGACDKIFINTAGTGRIIRRLSIGNISARDKIIVTGQIGQHGFSVLAKRKELGLGFDIKSDCAALDGLLIPVLKASSRAIRFMRDPTRGGLAATLNEIAQGSGLGIVVNENDIPVSRRIKAAGELLGIDPLYAACEGRAVIVVKNRAADRVLSLLRKHPLGQKARIIGEVTKTLRRKVVLRTIFNTERIIDMLTGDPLPRIC